MSEQKSLSSVCIACLLGAIVFWKGVARGNQNGTNTWIEMLNVVKDGIFWVFMVIFTILIFAAIIFVFFVTFEKIRAAFVNWFKSEKWCAEVDKDRDEQKHENTQLKKENRELKTILLTVKNELADLQENYQELRAFTGIDIKQAEARAEEEVLEGV